MVSAVIVSDDERLYIIFSFKAYGRPLCCSFRRKLTDLNAEAPALRQIDLRHPSPVIFAPYLFQQGPRILELGKGSDLEAEKAHPLGSGEITHHPHFDFVSSVAGHTQRLCTGER